MRWPDDFFTAAIVLVIAAALIWVRNRYPTRHDISIHVDDDRNADARKPPPEPEDPDGG